MSYFRLLKFLAFVGEGGLEPPNSSEDRFTVCCNCRYATPPYQVRRSQYLRVSDSSRWRDSNPRQADYKSATLPTELHRLISTFQTTLIFPKSECKNTTFSKTDKLFFHFLLKKNINTLINSILSINIFSTNPPPAPSKNHHCPTPPHKKTTQNTQKQPIPTSKRCNTLKTNSKPYLHNTLALPSPTYLRLQSKNKIQTPLPLHLTTKIHLHIL